MTAGPGSSTEVKSSVSSTRAKRPLYLILALTGSIAGLFTSLALELQSSEPVMICAIERRPPTGSGIDVSVCMFDWVAYHYHTDDPADYEHTVLVKIWSLRIIFTMTGMLAGLCFMYVIDKVITRTRRSRT